MKQLLIIFMILITLPGIAQQRITLNECYHLVAKNYPLANQLPLFEIQNKLETQAILTSKLPQLSLDAQATYQSDVMKFPLVMSGIEPINKDQYRATFSVNQLLYNGGATEASLHVKASQLHAKQKQTEVDLYQLKKQINQLYFSVLLAQESTLLLSAKEKLLQAKLKEVQSGIEHGVILPTSDNILQAELLKINQQFENLESNKTVLMGTLSSLIGKPINLNALFENPLIETQLQAKINRPELELFQLKQMEIEKSKDLLSKQNTPKLLGFATAGYGNPGLNMLDNAFQTFYTVGAKLSWNVFDWNSNKKQQQALAINKNLIDNETDVFKLNTTIELNKNQKEISKIEKFIISDLEIISLRKVVLKTAESQLKNGVITASAYITELTNLFEDENTLITHKIELEHAKANYNIIKGQ